MSETAHFLIQEADASQGLPRIVARRDFCSVTLLASLSAAHGPTEAVPITVAGLESLVTFFAEVYPARFAVLTNNFWSRSPGTTGAGHSYD